MHRLFAVMLLFFAAACIAKPVPARVLERWQPQQDTLTQQDTARAWQFNGQQGDAVRLRLDAKAGGQVMLALQDAGGNLLAQGNDLSYMLPSKGVYTVLVTLVSGEGTTYSLTLSYPAQSVPSATPTLTNTLLPTRTPSATLTPSNTPTATFTRTPTYTPTPVYAPLGTLSGSLAMNDDVEGSFLSEFERHIYLFSGAADEEVTLTMVATSGTVDPVLTLYDPTGKALATDDNSGGGSTALLRDIRLPADGTYIVQALGGGTGEYRLRLQSDAPPPLDRPTATATPTPPPGTTTPSAIEGDALQDHVPVLGMIEPQGDFDRYFVEAQAGAILTVSARPVAGSALRPRLEIYTPAGELMLSVGLNRDGQALIPSLGVIESGKYGVYVSDDGNAGGAYTLAYGRGDTVIDDLHGAPAPEIPVAGSRFTTVRDVWVLPLLAGDQIEVQATGAALTILAPDGTTVAEARDRTKFTAAASGDYRIYGTGIGYTLVWRTVLAAPTEAPALLILSAEDLLPAHTYLYYPFQGEAGRRIHIHVQGLTEGLDPVASLLDSSGGEVAAGDDSGSILDPDFTALLPEDGTYTLRINGYGDAGGTVRVTVEMLS